jgi:sugar phosphate isomerase/epimerase
LGLSTCWAATQARQGEGLLQRLAETGIHALELEYRLTAPQLNGLLPRLRPDGFSVLSVHNYVPVPPDLPPERASGDLFNLAAPDKEERLLAVRYTQRSLELASEVEASAVVLHLGWVEGDCDGAIIKDAAAQGETTPALAAYLEGRGQGARQALDGASFALERLLPRAETLGVRLALENRYHAYQVPDLAETRLLLERFAGAPLAPWLDLGHAHTQGLAGLPGIEDWLQAFGPDLLGCHLHDAVGAQDHKPPGQGDLDWEDLAPKLIEVPLKVLEIHPGPKAAEIAESAAKLSRVFKEAEIELKAQKEGQR